MKSIFKENKNVFLWDYQTLHQLEEKHGSSYYVLDTGKLKDNYRKMNHAFQSRYENFIIGYSYKTNYLPYLCKELSKLGAYAEVVSRLEYDLAIRIGENPKKIIFNGPLKSKEDIFLALENASIVNLDSMYEIEYVREYAQNHRHKDISVGVRLNFDLSENGMSILQDGYEVSRFGICVENGDLNIAISELKREKNIRIIGLHGHFSTRNRTVESYLRKTERLCHLAKEYINETLEFIDIGGGIYGELPNSFQLDAPSFDDYAEVICSVMNKEFPDQNHRPILILEPGVAMVANVMSFVSKVIEVKSIKHHQFVLVDGSVHNIKPTMHRNNLPMKVITGKERKRDDHHYHVVGYTCMEKDYLAYNLFGEMPDKGDYLIFENVGAYTIVFNPPFIKERPGILVLEKNEILVAREKETFKQFFNEELYSF
ncbi:diaminopimelate decarboxylase [Robertmurraya andreesenii]|uniref:Diaminopimelate decarboxylase n=1 Tax=Anoxybacillus andreesenii TaxID=1325932 RepID=A0ABT9V351_9BACL|nr:diaminopimelate decarboxylase [Robertmurraya andreesenii]MDQ0155378.1 diaminopimelate decarboxylase [Robertmurraya andreesenii]